MSEYAEFLQRKVDYGSRHGFDPLFMPDFLFDFQRAIVDSAVRAGRRGIGVELKPTYFNQARKNLETVNEATANEVTLFDLAAE